jgi:hypothetical protein
MSTRSTRYAGLVLALLLPSLAIAQTLPDATQTETVTVNDPSGTYTVTKTVQVWAPSNASNPCPVAGFCYVYTLANSPTSFLGLIGFEVGVPTGSATDAGYLPGSGVVPSATNNEAVPGVVDWDFFTTAIAPGQTSESLYIVSPLGPSTRDASLNGQFGFDAPTSCLGPDETVGEPMPCTIGFWKNRAAGKNGLLQFFPDPDFDTLVADAVALSNGLFADAADLLTNLQSKGQRSIEIRGKQQLAATFLNLAAGDRFPNNQKCKLFDGNVITTNGCGDNLFVGAAVTQALTDIAGDSTAQHHAQECSDDINNSIGIAD